MDCVIRYMELLQEFTVPTAQTKLHIVRGSDSRQQIVSIQLSVWFVLGVVYPT